MILHIVSRAEWEAAVQSGAAYEAPSLADEGFIHCSTAAQVLGPANEFYRGQDELVLLVIDPDKLTAELVYEDCYEKGEKFPHIYGPLNLEAVVEVVDFPAGPDGIFSLPPGAAGPRD